MVSFVFYSKRGSLIRRWNQNEGEWKDGLKHGLGNVKD